MAKFYALFLLPILLNIAAFAAGTTASGPKADSVEKAFQSGGDIHLQLSSADYDVTPGKSDEITVSWTGKKPPADNVQVRVETVGSSATVKTTLPKFHRGDLHFNVEVPPRSNLWLRAVAGDVDIGPIEGNVNVRLDFGDLHVNVADARKFGSVDASTRIGDLDSGPFQISPKGCLGKSIHWHGSGPYSLDAHVGTGDVVIAAEKKAE